MQNNYQTLLLHIPHASKKIPANFAKLFKSPELLQELLRKYTDTYTDELFQPREGFSPEIVSQIFQYSRLFCDVERLPHDPLEEKGLGIHYDLEKLGWSNSVYSYDGRDYKLYLNHHKKLFQILETNYLEYYPDKDKVSTLLIDCHSFSRQPNELCPNPPQDIDICIGFNEDFSRPPENIINLVTDYFRSRGYRVALNSPFSNSKTIDTPYNYHSLMIEVCKSLYMNEATEEKLPNFEKVHTDILGLYVRLFFNKDLEFMGRCNQSCYVKKEGNWCTGLLEIRGRSFGLRKLYKFVGNGKVSVDPFTLQIPYLLSIDNKRALCFLQTLRDAPIKGSDEEWNAWKEKASRAAADIGYELDISE